MAMYCTHITCKATGGTERHRRVRHVQSFWALNDSAGDRTVIAEYHDAMPNCCLRLTSICYPIGYLAR